MLRAIIVDDELRSRESLKKMIQAFVTEVEVSASCKDVREAVVAIDHHHPDIVFLDVQMEEGTGFDLLTQLQEIDFEVIFTTAYEEHALKAIKFSAIDYLLKPIHLEDLRQAVAKVEKQQRPLFFEQLEQLIHNLKPAHYENAKIALPSADGLTFVKISEILYCRASGNYTDIFIKGGKKIVVSRQLKEYEELLSPYNFFRIHHNTLVQIDYIQSYIRGEGGYVVMSDNASLDVSRRKKDAFLERIRYR